MKTRDSLRIWVASNLLLWFGLLAAPVLLADDAWQAVEHPTIDFVYVNTELPPTLHHFVHVEPVSVWYPNTAENSDAQAASLRRAAAEQFAAALGRRGLTEVAEAIDASLVVRVQMIDLRTTPVSADVLAWAEQFQFRVAPGRVTFVAELRDANSGRVLVRMADLDDSVAETAAASADYALAEWGSAVAAVIAPQPDLLAAMSD